MENIALIDSFSEFKDNKSIDRVTLMSILEEVFRAALKRKFGSDDNFDIIINPDNGDLEIWRNRVVVAAGFSEDDNEEIELAEARLIEPDFEIGEDVSEEVKLIDLGRRAILALRQNLISKIYEHDSTNIFKQFKDLEGELFSAEVHHIRHNAIILFKMIRNGRIPSISLTGSGSKNIADESCSHNVQQTLLGSLFNTSLLLCPSGRAVSRRGTALPRAR